MSLNIDVFIFAETKLTMTGRKAFIFNSKPLLTPTVDVENLQCEREEGGKVIRNYDPG